MRRSHLRHLHSDQTATSAVEFAILAPVFLLILLGTVAYGIYFGASHSVEQVAADAARAAVAGLSESERRAIVAHYVADNAAGYPLLDPANLTVDTSDNAGGDAFTVTATYDAAQLPIWNLTKGLPLPRMTILRRSVIRMGGV